jgi:hypothetical protein
MGLSGQLRKHRLYHVRGKDYGVNRHRDPAKTYPNLMEGRNLRGHSRGQGG